MKVWLRKYFTVIYLLATLLGVLHHHNDFKQHNDCKICLVKSNLAHADTPDDTAFLPPVDFISEPALGRHFVIVITARPTSLLARAPPKFS